MDTKPFDPNFYEDVSSDEDEIHDEEGRARLKLKVFFQQIRKLELAIFKN